MKKSIIVVSLLALGLNAVAADVKDNWFIGAQIGNSEDRGTTRAMGWERVGKDSDKYYGVKVGKYFEYGRWYVNYNYYDVPVSTVKMQYIGAGYDYLFYNKTDLTPYMGINAGYERTKINDLQSLGYDQDTADLSGLTYGVEIGALYQVSKHVDIEIFASYYKVRADDTLTYNNSIKVKTMADDITHVGIGVNYNF